MTMICEGDMPAYGFSAERSLHDCSYGLTKRELLAAMAMQGLCSGGFAVDVQAASVFAVKHADSLIAELSK